MPAEVEGERRREPEWISRRESAPGLPCICLPKRAWSLPSGSARPSFEWRVRSINPVDDLVLVAGDGSAALVQVKRTVNLSVNSSSAIASALDQFVRQFLEWRTAKETEVPADPAQGRLVLAVGTATPGTVRVTLREALDRLRALPGDELPRARTQSGTRTSHRSRRCPRPGILGGRDGFRSR